MRHFTQTAKQAGTFMGGVLVLASVFGCSAKAPEPDDSKKDTKQVQMPAAQKTTHETVTKEEQKFKNIPGNEFHFTFTSNEYPSGKALKIDPDNTMIALHKGKRALTFRLRFLTSINDQLPAVKMESSVRGLAAQSGTEGDLGVDWKINAVMFDHLVKAHGVPAEQIWEALEACYEPRGLPKPSR